MLTFQPCSFSRGHVVETCYTLDFDGRRGWRWRGKEGYRARWRLALLLWSSGNRTSRSLAGDRGRFRRLCDGRRHRLCLGFWCMIQSSLALDVCCTSSAHGGWSRSSREEQRFENSGLRSWPSPRCRCLGPHAGSIGDSHDLLVRSTSQGRVTLFYLHQMMLRYFYALYIMPRAGSILVGLAFIFLILRRRSRG